MPIISKTPAGRVVVAAGFGLGVGLLLWPVPLALGAACWPALRHLAEAAHSAGGIAQAETAWVAGLPKVWRQWLAHGGYAPWHAVPALFSYEPLVLAWLGLSLAGGGLLGWKTRGARQALWGGPAAAGRGQHGTAHWRGRADLRRGFTRWAAPLAPRHAMSQTSDPLLAPADLPSTLPSGILVGAEGAHGAWVLGRDEHALILGSTGAGKTRRLIVPSIGVIGTAARESLVLTDPKGEVYDMTAAWLESRGYETVRIDLIEPAPGRTRQFNPVARVSEALHPDGGSGQPGRPNYAKAALEARKIAHILTYASGSLTSTEPIWINGQMALTTALILAVAQLAPPGQRHLGSVYATLMDGKAEDGAVLDEMFAGLPANHPAALAYGTVQLSQGKTRASFLTSTAGALQMWGDPEIAWLTAHNALDLATVGRRPTAVYLILPFEEKSRYSIAGLYVSQMFAALAQEARLQGGELGTPVNFLLDEMGNMPAFPDFDQFITVCRSLGIRLTMALQNIEQLTKHYEKTARTIRGNAGTWLFLKTADLQSAEEVSKILGKYTTRVENHSRPVVSWFSSAAANIGSASESDGLSARSLVEPDELLRWPPGRVLVWQAGHAPADLPLPDLSAWARIWPALQKRHPYVPASSADGAGEEEIAGVRLWRPSNVPEPATPPAPRPAFPGSRGGLYGGPPQETDPEGG